MAFVAVTGSNGVWEYDNAATAADTYSDAQGTVSGGIRTQTRNFQGHPRFALNETAVTSTIFVIDDLTPVSVGDIVTGSDIVGTVTVLSIDEETSEVTLSSSQTLGATQPCDLIFTKPPHVTKTYIKCRKTGETHLDTSLEIPVQVPTIRGELSKDYYDNQ
jgi:hypothetical protein